MHEGVVLYAIMMRIKKPTGSGVFYKKMLPSTSRKYSFSVLVLVKSLSCCTFWLFVSANLFFFYCIKNGGGKNNAATNVTNHEQQKLSASKVSKKLRIAESTHQEDPSTRLRRNPPPFKYCRAEEEKEYEKVVSSISSTTIYPFCEFARSDATNEPIGKDGFQVVSRKIKVVDFSIETNELLSDSVVGAIKDGKHILSPPRILCIVYSTSTSPDHGQAVISIEQTWG